MYVLSSLFNHHLPLRANPPAPENPRGSLVVEDRVPIWRYGMALHLLNGSPAAVNSLPRSEARCGGGGQHEVIGRRRNRYKP